MKKIEAIIRPEQLEDIKESLKPLDLNGISITQIMGFGCQKGWTEFIRGSEVDFNFLPKIKIELIVSEEHAENVIEQIIAAAKTGEIGDGKIFISEIQDAIRIRTGERGLNAIK
ncbi:MAG: family nitrogen regulator [Caproiciproducens sp.]|jgi:nitrogen regulatory protein P-II 1|nr:family nitrogen regulator [Caproiciproducens sp.]